MNPRIVLILLATFTAGGCASSPISGSAPSRSATSRAAVYAAGAGGGAAAGMAATGGSRYGAVVGAALGTVTAIAVNNSMDNRAAQVKAEIYEQGRRDARVEVLKQFWYDRTTSYSAQSEQPGMRGDGARMGSGEIVVGYDAGVYNGVNMLYRPQSIPVVSPPR